MNKNSAVLFFILFIGLASAASTNSGINDPIIGEKDAKVTIEVWCSFQDHSCSDYNQNVLSILKEEYAQDDRVRILWKDKPLGELHSWAKDSAVMMECVYRTGGSDDFWRVNQKLLSSQSEVNAENYEALIKNWTLKQGISESSFTQCSNESSASDEVEADIAEADQEGIDGIPTTEVNGERVVGFRTLTQVESLIEIELDEKYSDKNEYSDEKSDSIQDSKNNEGGLIAFITLILRAIGL
jgi:protein-disulfide isomerase